MAKAAKPATARAIVEGSGTPDGASAHEPAVPWSAGNPFSTLQEPRVDDVNVYWLPLMVPAMVTFAAPGRDAGIDPENTVGVKNDNVPTTLEL